MLLHKKGKRFRTPRLMDKSVLIVGHFNPLGNFNICQDLAYRLSGAGWQVTATSRYRRRIPRVVDLLVTAYVKRRRYRVAHVDVYSARAFLWAEAVCLLLRHCGKPYALTLRDGNMPAFSRNHAERVRRLLASAAVVTAPSRYLLECMTEYRQDLCLLPNAMDLSAYDFTPRVFPSPSLIWLRAFNFGYNPNLAAKVIALLKDSFPTIRLTMIGADKGDGSFQSFQQRVSDLDLNRHIECPGWVSKTEVPQQLARHDIFLNTTNVDNTPVSVMEAMACGLCVVSTNVGGIPYLLEDGQDALLVPPDDPETMASAVSRILTEEGLAERLSRNARAKALKFDWSVILPQWEAMLSSLLEMR